MPNVNPMRRALAAIALAAALAGCQALPPSPLPAGTDAPAIRQVVHAFSTAILNKDKPAYMALFFGSQPAAIGWQAVVDDAKLASIRKTRPQAIKARPLPDNNFVALIDSVVSSPTRQEERISGLQIDSDGEIASAAFDYGYYSDGRLENWGRELWQLVRTEQGWKIFSVVYTIRDPAR